MTTRIPQLLSPYICIPPQYSLTLLTGLLGASANWLVIRYLYAALGSNAQALRNGVDRTLPRDATAGDEGVAVVLMSWMRDFEFWKTEARRAAVCNVMQ